MSEAAIEDLRLDDIQVVKAGSKGPNILLLHPAGQLPLGMKEHIKPLAEVGQVIAPNIYDIIGYLMKRGIEHPFFADIVNEFSNLKALDNTQPTSIVATSFGGSFAWEYARQHPDEVDYITAGSPTGIPFHRTLHRWAAEFLKEFVWEQTTQVPKEVKLKDPGPGLFIGQAKKDLPAVWQGLQLAMTDDARDKLPSINQRVDLLWGRKDNYIPLHTGVDMLNRLPNARLEIVSEYNHNWYMNEPAKVTGPAIARIKAA